MKRVTITRRNLRKWGTACSRHLPADFNPARQGGFLCSTEHGKLCFEQLQRISAAQNNLPLQGAENASEVSLFLNNKLDLK